MINCHRSNNGRYEPMVIEFRGVLLTLSVSPSAIVRNYVFLEVCNLWSWAWSGMDMGNLTVWTGESVQRWQWSISDELHIHHVFAYNHSYYRKPRNLQSARAFPGFKLYLRRRRSFLISYYNRNLRQESSRNHKLKRFKVKKTLGTTLGKLYSAIRKMYSRIRKFYSKIRKFYSKIRKLYSTIRKNYSNIRKLYSTIRHFIPW